MTNFTWNIVQRRGRHITVFRHNGELEPAVSIEDSVYQKKKENYFQFGTNAAMKNLALLLRNREVTCSNLGPETSYPDLELSWLSSVVLDVCQDDT
jgi:hypothetical protein